MGLFLIFVYTSEKPCYGMRYNEVCVCMYVSMCVCVCVCACMYVCMYVGMHACMYVFAQFEIFRRFYIMFPFLFHGIRNHEKVYLCERRKFKFKSRYK